MNFFPCFAYVMLGDGRKNFPIDEIFTDTHGEEGFLQIKQKLIGSMEILKYLHDIFQDKLSPAVNEILIIWNVCF